MTSLARDMIARLHAAFKGDHSTAVYHVDGDMTFDALHAASCALARRLAGPNKVVMIRGHKSAEYLIAYWAGLLTGRAIIPIEPDTPLMRIGEVAQACGGATLVDVYHERLDTTFDGVEILTLDNLAPETDEAFAPLPRQDSDAAYIMFSSGTSGKPKGIQVSYRNLACFVDWLEDDLMAGAEYAAISGNIRYCFDVSLFELWGSWLKRIPLSALDHRDFSNSRLCIARFAEHEVGAWISTPSALQFYLRDKTFNGTSLPALRTFLFCGETLPKTTVSALMERFPKAKIINTYGPTECTVAVTSVEITQAHLNSDQNLPIGLPRKGCTLAEVEGQISIIGHDVVGLGYVNLPEKQAAAFPQPDTYRTGDIGWLGDNGQWYFGGRADREIKLQGIRVDLNEIETQLRDLPGVEAAYVAPHLIRNAIRAIDAYVCGPKDETDLANIAEAMSHRLPNWMVPKFWYGSPEFNFNQNSKFNGKEFMANAQAQGLRYVHG